VNRKPKPPPDDPEQSARFVEAAKAHGENGPAFTKAVKSIMRAKTPKKRSASIID
jgi:hypothetical protein